MTQLKIKIDKEILKASQFCRIAINGNYKEGMIGQNCAIAKAICNIFPNAWVGSNNILFFNSQKDLESTFDFQQAHGCYPHGNLVNSHLPPNARNFIRMFDIASPMERLEMPEMEFTIDIPDSVIEKMNIDDVKEILKTETHLQLIEN